MRNECNFIRDILPLYIEGMVSDDTVEFVKEHLEKCPECKEEYESMKKEGKLSEVTLGDNEQRADEAHALITLKKKLRKKKTGLISITAICVVVVITLLHLFPIYRIAQVGGTSYYNSSEIAKLAYIGSSSDRTEAQAILRLADKAFNDHSHTDAENDEEYGVLSRYATNAERRASITTHSLELWSAHLGDTEGYLWVYYSYEAVDSDGDTVCGSYNIPALWKVEKDETGTWIVTDIKEHP